MVYRNRTEPKYFSSSKNVVRWQNKNHTDSSICNTVLEQFSDHTFRIVKFENTSHCVLIIEQVIKVVCVQQLKPCKEYKLVI